MPLPTPLKIKGKYITLSINFSCDKLTLSLRTMNVQKVIYSEKENPLLVING
jgi:hypothetical protein